MLNWNCRGRRWNLRVLKLVEVKLSIWNVNSYWQKYNPSVTLDGRAILVDDDFLYLRSIIQKDGELDSDVAYPVKASWLKWRSATDILCDCNMP
jgi:hypothetical protein